MLTIIRRTPGNLEKPSTIVREQSSRLPWVWDSLCFAVPINSVTVDGLRDLITGTRPTLGGGSNSWTLDTRGNPAWKGLQNYWLTYADNPKHDQPSTAITAYIRIRRNGVNEGDGGLFCNRYNGAAPYTSWIIMNNTAADGRLAGNITVSGVNNWLGPNTNVTPTNQYMSIFLRWRSGEAPTFDIFGERGDVLDAYVYGSTVSGTISYAASQGIRINCSENPDITGEADFSQCMLWNRKLGDAEMRALVADPFGWYSPRRETVGLAAPFPVGPGLAEGGMLYIGATRS